MARLSIVIPCLGDAAEFDGTLVSVLQNRPADCEIVVAHREAYDDPYGLQGEVQFLHCEGDSLAQLVNTALAECSGQVVHILGCGLEATENWTAAPLSQFVDPDVASVSPLILDRQQKLIAAGIFWSLGGARRLAAQQRLVEAGSGRHRAKIVGPTLSASFWRREVLVALGGLETTMTDQVADAALSLSLRALGKLHVIEANSRLIQVAEPTTQKASSFLRARALERLYWRNAAQHSPAMALPLHGAHLAIDCAALLAQLRLLPTLLGRLAAWCELGAVRRHQRAIEQARCELAELSKLRVVHVNRPATAVAPAARRKAA